jgi:hypothetical protein
MGLAGPMSATELEEVQALIERVLPDPRGFAGRLLQQAVAQYGQFAEPAATDFYAAATAEDVIAGESVIVADQWAADQPPVDISMLLAAALGACECWGLQADCDLCRGRGSAGWIEPEPELFDEFVRPAIERLPGSPARGHQRHDPVRTSEDSDSHQTAQGENA